MNFGFGASAHIPAVHDQPQLALPQSAADEHVIPPPVELDDAAVVAAVEDATVELAVATVEDTVAATVDAVAEATMVLLASVDVALVMPP